MEAKLSFVALCQHINERCVISSGVHDLLLAAFVAGLPVLIEDVPGVGKTTIARTLAEACMLDFARIQGAPDLLPADISGTDIWDQESRSFRFRKGPILNNIVLIDELNRAGTRTQAALLEAMEEGQVSIDGRSIKLPEPFFMIATQNPSGFAGTYSLPEAQLDRFGLLLHLGYPPDETRVLRQALVKRANDKTDNGVFPESKGIVDAGTIIALRKYITQVHVSDSILDYCTQILAASRGDKSLLLGLSPRAGIHWLRISQALAWMAARNYVIPDDLSKSAIAVLSHRVMVKPQARLEGLEKEQVISNIIRQQRIPNGL